MVLTRNVELLNEQAGDSDGNVASREMTTGAIAQRLNLWSGLLDNDDEAVGYFITWTVLASVAACPQIRRSLHIRLYFLPPHSDLSSMVSNEFATTWRSPFGLSLVGS